MPANDKVWINHFQKGAGFHGSPYQRGAGLGNIFRNIFRFILPIAKSAGQTVGKQMLKTGADIATDVLAGKEFKDTIKVRGKEAAADLLDKASNKMKGGRKKGPAKKSIKGTRKRGTKHSDQLGVYYK